MENITKCELIVLNVVWEGAKDMTLMEVIEKLVVRYQKNWKQQTVSTFLKRLVEKEYITFYRVGRQYYYRALISKQECFEKELLAYADVWQASPSEFIWALLKSGRNIEEDIKQLKKKIVELE